ncbi:MAG: hypothetical protein GY832_12090 [Chloroflexi bacterium]|nr:hypothetical protein [Chloroflexota bacterium]
MENELECSPPITPTQPAMLDVNPINLNFATEEGDNPYPQTLSIDKQGETDLIWAATEDIAWLNLNRVVGVAPSVVSVWVDIDGLSTGVYTGRITIEAINGGSVPQVVNARLVIEENLSAEPIYLWAEAGRTSVQLEWNPTNDPDVTSYHLYRAVGNDAEMSFLTTVSDTIYFDTDTVLLPGGTTYCYRVEAVRSDNTVAAISNAACATIGQVELWIPDVYAIPGGTGIIPLNVANAHGLRIAAGSVWLDYDPTVMTPLSVSPTALSADYIFTYSIASAGVYSQVRIATLAPLTPSMLYDDGALFELTVQVAGALTGTTSMSTPLDLQEFIYGVSGSSIYVLDDLFTPIPLVLDDGILYTDLNYTRGDVNGNGVVEAVDAYIVLQIAAGLYPDWTWEMQIAGDVNGDGTLDAEDASMILYYAVNGNWPPLPGSGNMLALTTSAPIITSLDNAVGDPGETVSATLHATNLTEFAGGEFIVIYDTSLVTGTATVAMTGLAKDFSLAFFDNGAGILHITAANDTPISGNGAIAIISLLITPGAPSGSRATLALAKAKLNDIHGRDFATSALQKTIVRNNGLLQVGGNQIYLPIVLRGN